MNIEYTNTLILCITFGIYATAVNIKYYTIQRTILSILE